MVMIRILTAGAGSVKEMNADTRHKATIVKCYEYRI